MTIICMLLKTSTNLKYQSKPLGYLYRQTKIRNLVVGNSFCILRYVS
ncbi:protein of unknown function [Candidatus Nitrosocosmicus franklandus]|uniref:Uncharacterized protein n=1 Tax=Candidatus Nitrosocosmicus franklandianus TaxID=1798806 RepID=A0A484IDT6_9ARCH|nr:protein of unknown function [Candidatus Nitrosocosmicus franklandus]